MGGHEGTQSRQRLSRALPKKQFAPLMNTDNTDRKDQFVSRYAAKSLFGTGKRVPYKALFHEDLKSVENLNGRDVACYRLVQIRFSRNEERRSLFGVDWFWQTIETEEESALSRVCSIFSQILQLFSRSEFEQAVRQHKAERHARGFTCWGQFLASSSVS